MTRCSVLRPLISLLLAYALVLSSLVASVSGAATDVTAFAICTGKGAAAASEPGFPSVPAKEHQTGELCCAALCGAAPAAVLPENAVEKRPLIRIVTQSVPRDAPVLKRATRTASPRAPPVAG